MKPLSNYRLPIGAEDCNSKKPCKNKNCVRHAKRALNK